jgi:hypothetical protein
MVNKFWSAGKIWGVFVYFKLDYIMSSDVDNWQQR